LQSGVAADHRSRPFNTAWSLPGRGGIRATMVPRKGVYDGFGASTRGPAGAGGTGWFAAAAGRRTAGGRAGDDGTAIQTPPPRSRRRLANPLPGRSDRARLSTVHRPPNPGHPARAGPARLTPRRNCRRGHGLADENGWPGPPGACKGRGPDRRGETWLRAAARTAPGGPGPLVLGDRHKTGPPWPAGGGPVRLDHWGSWLAAVSEVFFSFFLPCGPARCRRALGKTSAWAGQYPLEVHRTFPRGRSPQKRLRASRWSAGRKARPETPCEPGRAACSGQAI